METKLLTVSFGTSNILWSSVMVPTTTAMSFARWGFFMRRTTLPSDIGGLLIFDINSLFNIILLNLHFVRLVKKRYSWKHKSNNKFALNINNSLFHLHIHKDFGAFNTNYVYVLSLYWDFLNCRTHITVKFHCKQGMWKVVMGHFQILYYLPQCYFLHVWKSTWY